MDTNFSHTLVINKKDQTACLYRNENGLLVAAVFIAQLSVYQGKEAEFMYFSFEYALAAISEFEQQLYADKFKMKEVSE